MNDPLDITICGEVIYCIYIFLSPLGSCTFYLYFVEDSIVLYSRALNRLHSTCEQIP